MEESIPEAVVNFGQSKYHVVIMHETLSKSREDRYILNICLALRNCGHKVTLLVSNIDIINCLDEMNMTAGPEVIFTGWWIPRHIFWKLRKIMSTYKAMWMALRMLFLPPRPYPTVILLDVHSIAMLILGKLTPYKLIYVEHFSLLKDTDVYSSFVRYTPSLFLAKFMKYATEIIVQSDCLIDVFQRSFPNVHKIINVFPPCVDIGAWNEEAIPLQRLIPDAPKNGKLFVVFGRYCKRSNFRLAIDAFEMLLENLDPNFKKITHLVIAGQCTNLDEKLFYNEIIEFIKDKPYASQVTFLRQLPVVHKKSLILECTAVLHPAKYELFTGNILSAMHLGRPIIAANSGVAARMLSHRISGILVDAVPQKFAAAMHKLMLKPTLQMFISDMAKDTFRLHYSFNSFSRKFNSMILKSAQDNEIKKQIKES